jgi:hypothetical protein
MKKFGYKCYLLLLSIYSFVKLAPPIQVWPEKPLVVLRHGPEGGPPIEEVKLLVILL